MSLKKYIGPNETIKLSLRQSEAWFFWQLFPLILGFAALFFFWKENQVIQMILASIIWAVIFWRAHAFFFVRYFFTEKAVYKLTGFLWKNLRSVRVEQIENIIVQQGVISRIFLHMGNLTFQTAGANDSAVILYRVPVPFKTKQKIEKIWMK